MTDVTHPRAGEELLDLAYHEPKDRSFFKLMAARFLCYSPDARAVVREDFTKFDRGVIEHGPMQLGDNPLVWLRQMKDEAFDTRKYIVASLESLDRFIARVEATERRVMTLTETE